MEEVKNKQEMKKTQVFNVIILDRSGSMECIRQAAVEGFNETLAGIKKAQEKFAETQDHFVSLVTFCSCETKHVYDKTPVADTHPLKMEDFQPCCTTPLYDAMGITLTAMRGAVKEIEDSVVVVTIITDGMENASHEYNGKTIKELVERLRGEGWTFTYMGANQDSVEVAMKLSIRNSRNFAYSHEGTRASMGKDISTRMNFFSRLSCMKMQEADGCAAPMSAEERHNLYTSMADEAFDEEEDQRSTKITSMKRAFILFWHGLTALLVGIANWFTVILGMRDDSKYGKILRRTVGSCFAFLMLLLAIAAGWDFCRTACYRLEVNKHFDDSYYDTQYISRNVTYYTYYDEDGFLKTADGKKTITGIKWIAKPLGMDSLICYSDGKKRGYFNMFTGKPVIEPKYSHAWIFSDGLASVDDGGRIKFIDASGKVVIDPQIPYIPGAEGYVFHNNRCIVHNERRDRFGLLDKQGKWVLQPEYFSIESSGNFWVVDNGEGKSVLDSTLNTVIPFTKGQIWVSSEYISVTLSNHIIQRYDHSGEIINDFYINDVSYMTYESDELRYSTSKNYNEEGTLTSETENIEPLPVEKMAKCRRYEAESGWYGLMTADGKVITPPSYCSIQAIGYDMYLCKDNDEDGVILNGKGERIS